MESKCTQAEACQPLMQFQAEIDSYQKCVESNLQELNRLNIKYEKTLREMSSIFDLFEHINLTTDFYNLHTVINDMLIGVLGATSSTIFSLEDGKLIVEASSISRKELKDIDAIKSRLKKGEVLKGDVVVYDVADLTEEISTQRGVQSAVCVPIMQKNTCTGLIYIEHKVVDYFKEVDKKYLLTLAIAVRLAIENAKLYSNLEDMALRDGLTGLYNRLYFNKEVNNCKDIHQKYGIPFILALADINSFRAINDSYGHNRGDYVIKHVGKLIENEVRKGDIVCRYEGDKFAVIFRNASDLMAIIDRLESIRKNISDFLFNYENESISVSCSFGVVSFADSKITEGNLSVVNLAEQALKSAKSKGRNTIVVYEK